MISMMVRRLTKEHESDVRAMETGIDDDYVVRILPDLLESESVYGAFYQNHLIGIAGYSLFSEYFAILGRLRTATDYRGHGVATTLLRQLIDVVIDNTRVDWIGLTTLDDNIPVHHIAQSLGLSHIVTYYSCILRQSSSEGLSTEGDHDCQWQFATSLQQKRAIIQQWFPRPEDNVLGMFPYEAYYPLVNDQRILDDSYLEKCYMLFHPVMERFIMLLADDKDQPYFHVKYFWDDLFNFKDLIPLLRAFAFKHQRYIWLDLAEKTYRKSNKDEFSKVTKWRLYGQKVNHIKQK